MLNKETKKNIISKFARTDSDVGSCEVQIALLSERIRQIATHLKSFPKDYHSQRGLIAVIAQRRTLLKYLKNDNLDRHNNLMKSLEENGYF